MQTQQFKPRHPMPIEDVEELTYMLKLQGMNSDAIGFMVSDGPEAVSWWHYYMKKGRPSKADGLYRRLLEGKQYMVPAQWPVWYDTSYDERHGDTSQRLIKPPRIMTAQEKARVNALIDTMAGKEDIPSEALEF